MKEFEWNNECKLIQAAKNGDRLAIERLVKACESDVAATVIGMLGSGDEAEDVGQETMIKLLNNLDSFKGEASLKTYVTRIAINASLDAIKRRNRFNRRFLSGRDEETQTQIENIAQPYEHADQFETKQLVNSALLKLKPEFRSVAILRLMLGFSTQEVAEMLKIAHGTVLSRLARAKQQLATLLAEFT